MDTRQIISLLEDIAKTTTVLPRGGGGGGGGGVLFFDVYEISQIVIMKTFLASLVWYYGVVVLILK